MNKLEENTNLFYKELVSTCNPERLLEIARNNLVIT